MIGGRRAFLFCGVSLQNYKTRVTAETRSAVAGLDPEIFGFDRGECCRPALQKLSGSFRVSDHFMVNSAIPATEWGPRYQNMPSFQRWEASLKAASPRATLTVCHTSDFAPGTVLRFQPSDAGKVRCLQYAALDDAEAPPWRIASVEPLDGSADRFVFVCAHRSRDARCGYCGPILVDLIRQKVKLVHPQLERIHVAPCSHIGGHVYAGNVLVYSEHGGVCFGCVTPNDVEGLVSMLCAEDGGVPGSLKGRIRGRMTLDTKVS